MTPTTDNICNEIIDGARDVVTVNCDYNNTYPPKRGRYVTIRRKDEANERQWMNFCEVEVMSCRPGRWGYNSSNSGDDCSRDCDRCRYVSETCRVSDGYCFTGCKDGLWGNDCDKQCDCPSCDRTTGCPILGESKQKSQLLILSNSIFSMQDGQICLLR